MAECTRTVMRAKNAAQPGQTKGRRPTAQERKYSGNYFPGIARNKSRHKAAGVLTA